MKAISKSANISIKYLFRINDAVGINLQSIVTTSGMDVKSLCGMKQEKKRRRIVFKNMYIF